MTEKVLSIKQDENVKRGEKNFKEVQEAATVAKRLLEEKKTALAAAEGALAKAKEQQRKRIN